MTTNGDRSVSRWLSALKLGDRDEASRQLWMRYFERLARLAHARFLSSAPNPTDGEDVALSTFDSLFRGVAEGRYPKLDDRDDLWKLLTTIAMRKASNHRRRERQLKRGGGRVVAAVDLAQEGNPLERLAAREPTPDLAFEQLEEFRERFIALPDESLRLVALLRVEGYSNDDIAKALDCSPRSVDRKLELIRKLWTPGVRP